uniref:Uncharacterized protein n=1 Tax=Cannabis sativa TaxID=3483 RepID=A0A803RAX8_CANSA
MRQETLSLYTKPIFTIGPLSDIINQKMNIRKIIILQIQILPLLETVEYARMMFLGSTMVLAPRHVKRLRLLLTLMAMKLVILLKLLMAMRRDGFSMCMRSILEALSTNWGALSAGVICIMSPRMSMAGL